MKATDIIRRDHRAAEDLFEKFKKASHERRVEMADEIFDALDTHEKMEDAYFYPALQEKLEGEGSFDDLEREQAELKEEVSAVREMSGNRDNRIKEIMETVLTHAKKEETEVLAQAEELLSAEELEELGAEMEPLSAVANSENKKPEAVR